MNFREKTLDFFRRHRTDLLVVLSYALITSIFLFFLLRNIGSALIPGDGLFTYWVMSWDIHSFLHHPFSLFNANIFYPHQNTLAYSEGFFAPALMALPLFLVFRNMIVANNLIIFLSYILSAWGAYKLAKYYTKNSYASFIAGLIFGFSTFKLISIGHFQSIMTFWMPFAVLHLQKYLDTKKSKYIIYFALLFSAQMLSSWNMGAFFALFVGFLLIANWKIIYDNFFAFAKDGLIALVIIIILVLPFAYPYFKLHQETHFSYPVQEIVSGSADIGGYIFPVPGTFMSRLVAFLGINKQHWSENRNFLGYFSILFLAYYFFFSKNKINERNFKTFIWGVPIFMIFSFGPILRFIPSISIPSLYYLILPVTGFIRTPSRISIIVLLCLSIVVAYIIGLIKIKNQPLKIILSALAPLFILFEFFVSHGSLFKDISCSETYKIITSDDSAKAIVEFPVIAQGNPDQSTTLQYIFNSTCHYKPIFNGYSGYAPPDYEGNAITLGKFPNLESIELMKSIGITHILLHLENFSLSEQKPLLEAVAESNYLKILYQNGKDYLIKVE